MTLEEYETLAPGDHIKTKGARGRIRLIVDITPQWCAFERAAVGHGTNAKVDVSVYSAWEIRKFFETVIICRTCDGSGPFRTGRRQCIECETKARRQATTETHKAVNRKRPARPTTDEVEPAADTSTEQHAVH